MIHYFVIWGENKWGRKLAYSPAGVNKAKYILELLSANDTTRVISFASGGMKYNGIYWAKKYQEENIEYRFCFTFGSKNPIIRLLERFLNIIQMLLYVLIHTMRMDILVFYNERYFCFAWRFAKYLHRKVIIEVEEVNCIAAGYLQRDTQNEINNMKGVDAYILVNNILPDYMPFVLQKPHCEIYGAYTTSSDDIEKFNDGKIHVLYSGTFNPTKGGASVAIKLSNYLPSNYQVHITGFGNERETEVIEDEINKLSEYAKKKLNYHGFISTGDLDILMQKCHIGLCTQDPSTTLNMTSFPSKIINYLSHNMVVVCGRNRAVESSDVGDVLCYYEIQEPKCIAKAIEQIQVFDGKAGAERIKVLHKCTSVNMQTLLGKI